MLSKSSLKFRLTLFGILLISIPLVIIVGQVIIQGRNSVKFSSDNTLKMTHENMRNVTASIYSLCKTQNESVNNHLVSSLEVAKNVMQQYGKISTAKESTKWDAVNQYTKNKSLVELPKMNVGTIWLTQNYDGSITSPVVDEIQSIVGGTCTFFQKMNEQGDMLRVSTNVLKNDGSRAIGTYIPAINPDNTPNPVVATVLKGQVYNGKAYVVNDWYLTIYEPVFDSENDVIGMLYVGVPMKDTASFTETIQNTRIGENGYVFVMDSKGNYIISRKGSQNGENVYNAANSNGETYIKEICTRAGSLKGNDIAVYKYLGRPEGVDQEKNITSNLMYYEPWDWVIGTVALDEEVYAVNNRLLAGARETEALLWATFAIALTTSIIFCVWFSHKLSVNIKNTSVRLTQGAEQVLSASTQIASASMSLAEGATEQAASIAETTSSLGQMASVTRQNVESCQRGDELTSQVNAFVQKGAEAMDKMGRAICDIQASSEETSKVIKVINDIAFQTNLLALNAAVEAARAGESGKGFAVVAEEVRNLAIRSAEAANNTEELIQQSVKNSENGTKMSEEVTKLFSEIAVSVEKNKVLSSEISNASNEQSREIEQINTTIKQMDVVTQQNASNAEQSASASEQLKSQAVEMDDIVSQLVILVNGSKD